jgi:hypothetical protein
MPTVDLTDEELAGLTAVLRRTIENDRFPLAPRLEPLRSALAKPAAAPASGSPKPPKAAHEPPEAEVPPILSSETPDAEWGGSGS